jgi:hypothetical protein
MMTCRLGLCWRTGVLAVALAVPAARAIDAIDLDVNAGKIEAGLRIARGSESGRAAFHRPYQFATNDPSVERVEVITEYRRLVLMGEERIAAGDRMFGQGGRMVEDAMRPWRRRVAVAARVRFSPQNAYVTPPPVEIVLAGGSGDVPRLDMRNAPQSFAGPGGTLSWTGVDAEAVFDATTIGQTFRAAIVLLGGKEAARVTIDFSRLD